MGSTTSNWFWDENFWLPSNVSWKDLQDNGGDKYPHIQDFYMVFPFAVFLIICRFFFERLLARPLGVALGVPTTRSAVATENAFLEDVFLRETKRPDSKRIEGLAKQTDLSPREVERWFRKRRCQQHKVKIDKFTESCWRFIFYISLFTYGAITIPQEKWFWNLSLCWHDFPFHAVSSTISNLYFMELSLYVSLLLSVFFDVRRKDFYPMLFHHIFTSLLLLFSWVCNFVRIGCLIIVIHDIADVFLESAKVFNYAKWSISAHVMFANFSLSFFFGRIVLFPFWVIHSSMVQSWQIIGPFPAWFFFNGLLSILMGLNIYWFLFILKMVLKIVFTEKENKKDVRSEDEMSDSDFESEPEVTEKVEENGSHFATPNGTTNSIKSPTRA